jgi:hypothetical protein
MIGIVAYNANNFFRVVAYNAEKCSNFSSCVFFPVVAYKANHTSCCEPQRRKMIGIVNYTA